VAVTAPRQLVVFSDDWGRHPSSCQHLVRGLPGSYEVHWFNTIGMRSPRVRLADLRRGVGKLREWLGPSRGRTLESEQGNVPSLVAPFMWPSFRRPGARRLNEELLARSLKRVLADRPTPFAIVTTVPVTGDLVRRTRHLNWVYYCADDYAAWPGNDGEVIRSMEHILLEHASRVIVVSEELREHVAAAGREAEILTHGVDPTLWRVPRRPCPTTGERPVALFWGRVDARLDVASCLALAEACDLTLLGAQENAPPEIGQHASISLPGEVAFEDLPRHAAAADVLVMPYADLPSTRAMQPLKLKEYLATGLPVLTSPLPAVEPWKEALDVCSDPALWAQRVRKRAAEPLPEGQRKARERLNEETWPMKTARFEQLIAPS
jgi:glycosyltransferase involved in cell wall biosynthesis